MWDAMSLAGHQANSARQLCACLDRNGRSGPERLCLLWIKPRLMKHSESFAGGRSTGLMRNCWTTCDHFSRIPEDYHCELSRTPRTQHLRQHTENASAVCVEHTNLSGTDVLLISAQLIFA